MSELEKRRIQIKTILLRVIIFIVPYVCTLIIPAIRIKSWRYIFSVVPWCVGIIRSQYVILTEKRYGNGARNRNLFRISRCHKFLSCIILRET